MKLDALIRIVGGARCHDFEDFSEKDYYLVSEVNLIQIEKDFMNPGGSITLSRGILADEPVPKQLVQLLWSMVLYTAS